MAETAAPTGLEGADLTSMVDFPTPSRVHVSLNISDLWTSLNFYRRLLDKDPTVAKEGYAKFEVAEPAINLTLNEFPHNINTNGHFGIQVKTPEIVQELCRKFDEQGFKVTVEEDVACCYAEQTKFWVADPDGYRWEVFATVNEESEEGCPPDCICYADLERTTA